MRKVQRPVLWFSKGERWRFEGKRTMPNEIQGIKNKTDHPWQQGPAVWQWIEPLTNKRDLIVDPFCGSGEWGRLAGVMERR